MINFLYYGLVIGISMFCLHPVILGLSLISGLAYGIRLKGWRGTFGLLVKFLLPGMLVVAIVNLAFNHYGVTPLLYLENGNAVTLEAILYGLSLAVVLGVSLTWFSTYNLVMTSDKFIYLFGKIIPASSLILSMVFRFVPKFQSQLQLVRQGQKSIGRDMENGRLWQKIKYALTTFSIMITWSLENAIDTADSMKARGYGLKGRTAFAPYRFDARDVVLLIWLGVTGSIFLLCWASGALYTSYNPQVIIKGWPLTLGSGAGFVAFFLLANLPLFLGLYDDYRWRRLLRQANTQATVPYYFSIGGPCDGTRDDAKL